MTYKLIHTKKTWRYCALILLAFTIAIAGCSDDAEGEDANPGNEPNSSDTPTSSTADSNTGGAQLDSASDSPVGDADIETAKARVSAFIDANTTGFWCPENVDAEGTRDAITEAIVRACQEFSPKQNDYDVTWCEAHLVAASCMESSMQADANFYESMADPPVGLLQDRFSATVQDYENFGPKEAMARIGCPWPDFSNVTDWGNPTGDQLEWLKTIPCNVGIGAWYYYLNATGNGQLGNPPVWAWNYCNGEGTAANLVIGLLCHLQGANAISYNESNPWEHQYVSTIRDYFDLMIPSSSEPHPFLRQLQPNVSQYCEQ